jgi:Kef-type K+ transport system membrane component KefB
MNTVTHRSTSWLLPGYAVMVGGSAALYLLIRSFGEHLTAPAGAAANVLDTAPGAVHGNPLPAVLMALLAIILASRAVGALFGLFHQPRVIGEVVAGILLGPSVVGHFFPGITAALFPSAVMPLLGIIAQIGVMLFMFVVGLELNTELLRKKTHSTMAISHASILLPFLMGSALALLLYPILSTRAVSFTAFSLFLGISMSVTAFPVLARILTDRKLQHSPLGTVALTCAAFDDVTAWCLLALVVGVIQAQIHGALLTAALTLLYIGAMFGLVRPLLRQYVERFEAGQGSAQGVMAVMGVALLMSSLATEKIGIHSLFGAFLLGAIVPHDSSLAKTLTGRLEDFVVVMLLPAFFALTGLRTQIGLISGNLWLLCALIILVACAGKFGGSAVAARLTGMNWRDASALGILMNTRGLMELIVLNIGLDLKVISPTLFAMLVIMAVVTTFATTPTLDFLTRRGASAELTGG